jgi:AhpD family alkylhydroperoxidase
MAESPREILRELSAGTREVSELYGEQLQAFAKFGESIYKPMKLDTKTKELISVALATYVRCKYCIVSHVYKAIEAGATPEEIIEAALVAVNLGGGPAYTYAVTLVKDAAKEFASKEG